MNDKNIKKQSSAQALDDNALENVAGGWDQTPLRQYLILKPQEKAYLNSLGISFETKYNDEIPLYKSFKDADGNSLSPTKVTKILEDKGYRQ